MPKPKLLSIPQVAQVTGLSYYLTREMVLNGTIRCVMLGSRRRVNAKWLDRWLARTNPADLDPPTPPRANAAQ